MHWNDDADDEVRLKVDEEDEDLETLEVILPPGKLLRGNVIDAIFIEHIYYICGLIDRCRSNDADQCGGLLDSKNMGVT